jgi:hypothetical protein
MLKAPMMTWLLAMLLVVMATMTAGLFDKQRITDERPRAMRLGATTTEWFDEQPNPEATTSSLDERLATLLAAEWTVRRNQRLSCARAAARLLITEASEEGAEHVPRRVLEAAALHGWSSNRTQMSSRCPSTSASRCSSTPSG